VVSLEVDLMLECAESVRFFLIQIKAACHLQFAEPVRCVEDVEERQLEFSIDFVLGEIR